MTVVRRFSIALMLTAALTGCAPLSHDPESAAPREYGPALEQASLEVRAGRYGIADHILAEFAMKFPSAPEAVETLYWRAVFKADPANQVALVKESLPLLDSYLAAPAAATLHRTEAGALKRLVILVESRAAVSSAPAPAAPAPAVAKPEAGKDEEIARLKEELQRANAELERIKRRLARPRP